MSRYQFPSPPPPPCLPPPPPFFSTLDHMKYISHKREDSEWQALLFFSFLVSFPSFLFFFPFLNMHPGSPTMLSIRGPGIARYIHPPLPPPFVTFFFPPPRLPRTHTPRGSYLGMGLTGPCPSLLFIPSFLFSFFSFFSPVRPSFSFLVVGGTRGFTCVIP